MMREKIRLNSTAGTGHFYTTTKNKRTMTEKLEIMKFEIIETSLDFVCPIGALLEPNLNSRLCKDQAPKGSRTRHQESTGPPIQSTRPPMRMQGWESVC